MSISFESAVETLKIMFPDWDEDTLSAILVSNNYHVENTIETVLSMSGEEEKTPSSTQTPSSSQAPMSANSAPPPQPSTGNLIDVDGSPTTKYSHSSVDSSAAVGKPSASMSTPSSSSSSSDQYRGLRVELPFDFLRPPGWIGSEQMIADEDLARMLQNEMFQQEAMRVEGGAELIAMMQRSNAQNRLRQQLSGQQQQQQQQQRHHQPLAPNSSTQRRPSHPASAAATVGHSNEPVDLGIMKALNTMGTATKQSLSQLAQAFKSKTTTPASSGSDIHSSSSAVGGTAATASSSSSSSSPQQSIRSPKQLKSKRGGSKTFQTLEDQEINHEDIYGDNDNVEVITFGSPSSNQHMLHGADDIKGDGDDDDAENPLLRQHGVYNNNVNLNKKSY